MDSSFSEPSVRITPASDKKMTLNHTANEIIFRFLLILILFTPKQKEGKGIHLRTPLPLVCGIISPCYFFVYANISQFIRPIKHNIL